MVTPEKDNPKDIVGSKKVSLSAVPPQVLMHLALAMMEGARKYGAYNWRSAGVRANVYYDAAMRHLMAWYEGEDIDPDSGLSHIIKAIATLVVLADSQACGKVVDNRPSAVMPAGWLSELNSLAERHTHV